MSHCCASVITDGRSMLSRRDRRTTVRTREEAESVKAQGIIILAIGIGSGVDTNELAAMASEPKETHWTNPGSFRSLMKVSEVIAGSCVPEIQDGASRVWGCSLLAVHPFKLLDVSLSCPSFALVTRWCFVVSCCVVLCDVAVCAVMCCVLCRVVYCRVALRCVLRCVACCVLV